MIDSKLLESNRRFAVTMWEYSWLVQRSGKQSEYTDWDKALDELVERGYDCIRIDAFPHLIAGGPDGNILEDFIMLPIPDFFMWGNHTKVKVQPRKSLIEFMNKVKERGIYVGLSSWYNDDTTHRKSTIKFPEDYSRIWIETLDYLKENDLLNIVVWVDICNEFPLPAWSPGAFEYIFDKDPKKMSNEDITEVLTKEWKFEEIRKIESYFIFSIEKIRERYPELKYTFSFQNVGKENIQKTNVKSFDFLEPHIWLTDDPNWAEKTKFSSILLKTFPQGVIEHAQEAMKVFPQNKKLCLKIFDKLTNSWVSWAKSKQLPLVTTEGWVSVLYEDVHLHNLNKEWEWFKEASEMAIQMAIRKGWQGICTSNFSEPHFEGMWSDIEWHKRMTSLIKKGY